MSHLQSEEDIFARLEMINSAMMLYTNDESDKLFGELKIDYTRRLDELKKAFYETGMFLSEIQAKRNSSEEKKED